MSSMHCNSCIKLDRILKRVSNIKPFINKYNWDRIKYPSKIDDKKTFEKSNPTIALDVLHIKEIDIYPAYISKINLDFEKQIIFVAIPNEKRKVGIILQEKTIRIVQRNTMKTPR